jgi:hypothetical protein
LKDSWVELGDVMLFLELATGAHCVRLPVRAQPNDVPHLDPGSDAKNGFVQVHLAIQYPRKVRPEGFKLKVRQSEGDRFAGHERYHGATGHGSKCRRNAKPIAGNVDGDHRRILEIFGFEPCDAAGVCQGCRHDGEVGPFTRIAARW